MSFYGYIKKNKMDKIFHPEFLNKKIKKGVYYQKILEYIYACRDYYPSLRYDFEGYLGFSFAFAEKMLSSKYLFKYIEDSNENVFVKYFKEIANCIVEREEPTLVGFSITAPSQVIASFTFGYLIKRYFPGVQIAIGGQWVSLFREALTKRNDFKSFYDYIVYFEGETPLLKLVQCMENKGNFQDVPNLIYFKDGAFRVSSRIMQEDMDKLPPPDFEDLPIMDYNDSSKSKRAVLTFETSRGCYWNKCIFCVDLPLPKPEYREKSPELVIQDIRFLRKKYNVHRLIISNATFSPSQMKSISELILKNGIKIKWWAFGRFDSGFTYETLKLAKKAGCIMLGFGLETINGRLLKFIKKGIKVGIIKRIIDDANRLKLRIYFQVIIGLPTETMQEALDNIMFLARYKGAYSREQAFNIYYLTPKNYIFEHPKECGIKFKKNPKLPFRFFYPFEHISGEINKETAQKLMKIKDILIQDRIKRDSVTRFKLKRGTGSMERETI